MLYPIELRARKLLIAWKLPAGTRSSQDPKIRMDKNPNQRAMTPFRGSFHCRTLPRNNAGGQLLPFRAGNALHVIDQVGREWGRPTPSASSDVTQFVHNLWTSCVTGVHGRRFVYFYKG